MNIWREMFDKPGFPPDQFVVVEDETPVAHIFYDIPVR